MSENVRTAAAEEGGRLFRLFFLLVLLLLFAAAVLSYSPTDAVILYGGADGVVDNWIGWIGAIVSHTLFMHLGLGCYLLPAKRPLFSASGFLRFQRRHRLYR